VHFTGGLQLFPSPRLFPFLEMLFLFFLNILRLIHLSNLLLAMSEQQFSVMCSE